MKLCVYLKEEIPMANRIRNERLEIKLTEEEKALSAAIYLQSATAYCIKNNYEMTGSYSLVSDGILKLLFNGAADIIEGINDV